MSSLVLDEFGSFHIGGVDAVADGLPPQEVRYSADWSETFDRNGTYAIEQMYVQYFVPAQRRGPPLVFWPGGGLSGVNFETTPDGRPGWLDFFLRRHRAVFNADPVERGRSGWAMYPQFFPDAPVFMTKERAFEAFRFGEQGGYDTDPAKRRGIPGTQFPLEAFDQFVKQIVPRWPANAEAAQRAFHALLHRTGPAIVVAFSSGATQAIALAEQNPRLFKGLVLIEPAGIGRDVSRLGDLQVLALFGDFLDRHPLWPGIRTRMQAYFAALDANASIVDLPQRGIHGNSHFMMMDRNNQDVAQVIEDWLGERWQDGFV